MNDFFMAQQFMKKHCIDAWLIYDFRGNNPLMSLLLGERWTTRRNCLIIPANGAIIGIAHEIDKNAFPEWITKLLYKSWEDFSFLLHSSLSNYSRIAMEYSPGGLLPTMGIVDAGAIELIRSFGKEVVSSAGIYQIATSVWPKASLDLQRKTAITVDDIKNKAFELISNHVTSNKSISEYEVQKFIIDEFEANHLETDEPPIVAFGKNSGDPHYQPTELLSSSISGEQWVLIDLWAKMKTPSAVFADITWVASIGKSTEIHNKIFNIVREARDMVVERAVLDWNNGRLSQGWELDRVARNHISEKGYEKYFIHRTGHSMGPGKNLHALGVNLDDLETHDTRMVIPGIGFSVEPGIYLPEFGVRLEIDVYIHPEKGPIVTSSKQDVIIEL
jgi:Xaa-Pro dipeptidase